MKKLFYSICLFVTLLFFFPRQIVFSQNTTEPAITVINLVRGNGLGHESDDLLTSLKVQWQITKEERVPATWLFQYGALENSGMTEFAKREMLGQDFGILFEIDRNFAEKSGVMFRGQGAWYFSDGLFLSSYDQSERRHLIDTAFAKFKQLFGTYPKTVGAWWIGGDALTYMQQKYGITTALRASNQFNLDFYSIWGTPWNVPYLAAKTNEGIPASSYEESSKVVILQWAIRDPLLGYQDPIYSLQDYGMKGYSSNYVDYLASYYLQKPFGNIVIGLENGGTKDEFERSYRVMLQKSNELAGRGTARIELAREFGERYLRERKVFAGKTYFLSSSYTSPDQSFWYVSEQYQAAIHKQNGIVSVVDLRDYATKIAEDFFILPNSQSRLRINEPSLVDSMRNPKEIIRLTETDTILNVKEQGNDVVLYTGNDIVARFSPNTCVFYGDNNQMHTFAFVRDDPMISPFRILLILYILYCGFLWFKKINMFFLLIPLCLAFPVLGSSSLFVFDTKEVAMLTAISSLHLFTVLNAMYVAKLFPIVLLLVLHRILMIGNTGKFKQILFSMYFLLLCFLYFRVPYFPLDSSTYASVALAVIGIAVLYGSIAFWFYRKHIYRNIPILSVGFFIVMVFIGVTIIISRSRLVLTDYEIQAMQFIQQQKKNVLFIEQIDYSVRPIYKAVKPVIYVHRKLSEQLTRKSWETVLRPENDILTAPGYEDKLLYIPRYLGSDLSEHEAELLHLTKIFDNTHIAIFEKQ